MDSLTHATRQAIDDVRNASPAGALTDERLHGELCAAFDGVVVLDSDGAVLRLSPAAEELLELRAMAVLGNPLADASGGELLTALVAELAAVGASRSVNRVVEVRRTLDRPLSFVRVRSRPTRDAAGRAAGTYVTLRDVTVEHKTDELRNRYLSIVAHELRTPLTGIKTFATLMAKGSLGPLSEPQATVMASIKEQILRLEHQIDKLVHLGNLDSQEFAQDLGTFDLGELVRQSVRSFERAAGDRRIDLRLDLPGSALSVRGDRAQLRRALQALVENAVKFSRDGGVVDVALATFGERQVEVSVADQGVGIDPRYHARIFEKFFQVEDPLTRHHGGSGLGLFFVKSIVEAHGSAVRVDSRLGSGARFSFVLGRVDEGPGMRDGGDGVTSPATDEDASHG
ncbi:MAG: ATP-binding protein [Planctomycetota bacterium]